ncbi:Uncharacterised protein [Legionella wadsworthii]|uniref:Uncharacterized protein n=1 Tax=Legionella wadsworthii TaxID=28088 RepID=A0A378LQZ7_9GAMM|nr:Uncharacterised protein [Legionella wadsworthii]
MIKIIKEIKPKEIYAVTGEGQSNMKMEDFDQEIPVHLSDLKMYFNTKGTLSDKYKPLTKYARKNMSEEERNIYYNNIKIQRCSIFLDCIKQKL